MIAVNGEPLQLRGKCVVEVMFRDQRLIHEFLVAKIGEPKVKFPPRSSASIILITDCAENKEDSGTYSAFSKTGQEIVKNS